MLRLLFSMVLSLTLGYQLIGCLMRTPSRHAFDRLLKFSLGTGMGLGLSSCIFFVGLMIFTPSGSGLRFFDTGIRAVGIATLFIIGRMPSSKCFKDPPPTDFSANPVLYYLFWASLMVSILTLGLMAFQSPYGGQDALGIWNLRARILLKGQGSWLQDLTTMGQHPDYPLLLPSLVARAWSYAAGGLYGADRNHAPAGQPICRIDHPGRCSHGSMRVFLRIPYHSPRLALAPEI